MHNFVVSDNYALCIVNYEFFLKKSSDILS